MSQTITKDTLMKMLREFRDSIGDTVDGFARYQRVSPGYGAGTRAGRPNANTVKVGYLYYATDNGITYQSDGNVTWTPIAAAAIRQTGTGWLAGTGGLPAPEDTQLVDYVADATNGVEWRFRYRSASASAYKWEYVGGAPLRVRNDAASSTITSVSYASPTGALTITLPFAGDYDMAIEAAIWNLTAGFLTAWVSYDPGGSPTSAQMDNWAATVGISNTSAGVIKSTRQTGRSAGTVVTEKTRADSTGSLAFSQRRLTVTPVRVG